MRRALALAILSLACRPRARPDDTPPEPTVDVPAPGDTPDTTDAPDAPAISAPIATVTALTGESSVGTALATVGLPWRGGTVTVPRASSITLRLTDGGSLTLRGPGAISPSRVNPAGIVLAQGTLSVEPDLTTHRAVSVETPLGRTLVSVGPSTLRLTERALRLAGSTVTLWRAGVVARGVALNPGSRGRTLLLRAHRAEAVDEDLTAAERALDTDAGSDEVAALALSRAEAGLMAWSVSDPERAAREGRFERLLAALRGGSSRAR